MSRKGSFNKGTSGNIAGRPNKSRNWKSLIAEALQETVIVKEGSKTKRVVIAELVMKSFIKKCLSGDPASLDFLLNGFTKADISQETFTLKMGKDLRKPADPE